MDPRLAPVIAAIGEFVDRPDDPRDSLEPLALMERAARLADEDGGGGWLPAIDSVDVVHQRSWRYAGTAARLCERLGLTPRRAVYGPYGGESPVRMIDDAARRIEAGTSGTALIVAGEAQYARSRAAREGWTPPWTPRAEREENAFDPTGVIDPSAVALEVVAPAQVYPLFETAWTAARGETQAQGVQASATLWARYAARAATNPFAWRRDAPDAAAIADPAGGNRWIAWPYTRAMVANPDVNQSAALIVTSLAGARARGIAEDRLIHVRQGAFASEPRNWLLRDRYDHSVAQTEVLRAMLDATPAGFDVFELYSCFPVVAKMAAGTLGQAALAAPSVAGGLSFFGGPLNGYMMHAATAMVRALRVGEGTRGLLYGQGEFVTKHHALVLAREPGDRPDAGHGDRQAAADAARGPVPPLVRDAAGVAVVEAHTVIFDRAGAPAYGVVVARGAEGWRALARSGAPEVIARLLDAGAGPIGARGVVLNRDVHPEWRFA